MIAQMHLNPLLESQHPRMLRQKLEVEIEDPKVVLRLVKNLMYLFNITPGDNITFILGQGQCSKNEDALKYWVMEQLTEELISQDDVLNYLVENLKRQLSLEVYS